MFRDKGRPWIVDHDSEVWMSRSMKCRNIIRGTKKVVKEPKGIWNNKNANRLKCNQTQCTNLNSLEDEDEEPWKHGLGQERDDYGIE
jgi:hypothetical protein